MYTAMLVLAYFLVGFAIDMWAYDDEEDQMVDDWQGGGYSFTIIMFWPLILLIVFIAIIRDILKGE